MNYLLKTCDSLVLKAFYSKNSYIQECDIFMTFNRLAKNIRFFRERYNLTQQQLADQLQLSRSVVAKWENELATPDIQSLLKLSRLFDVSLDHLVGNNAYRDDLLKEFKRMYESDDQPLETEIIELVEYLMINPSFKKTIQRIKSLPTRKQNSIQNLIDALLNEYEKI